MQTSDDQKQLQADLKRAVKELRDLGVSKEEILALLDRTLAAQ